MAFLHRRQEAANGICDRSPLVGRQIEKIVGKPCNNITTTDLAGISRLALSSKGIPSLRKEPEETLENLKLDPDGIPTPLSQQGFSSSWDRSEGAFPVVPRILRAI